MKKEIYQSQGAKTVEILFSHRLVPSKLSSLHWLTGSDASHEEPGSDIFTAFIISFVAQSLAASALGGLFARH